MHTMHPVRNPYLFCRDSPPSSSGFLPGNLPAGDKLNGKGNQNEEKGGKRPIHGRFRRLIAMQRV
jgi:hypothetical protein